MKKTLLLLIILITSTVSYAQELSRQKEIGLTFTSLDNFGITYRIGKENSLWRFNLLSMNGNKLKQNQDSIERTYSSNGFNFRIGKEFRKSIVEKLVFRFGADLQFQYSKSESNVDDKTIYNYDTSSKTIMYGPGINLVIGLNYQFANHFTIGAELLPSFLYTIGTSTDKNPYNEIKSDITNYSYGFSNSLALLSIVYQF